MVKFKTFCAITVCLILAYVLFSSIIRLGEYMAREARESEAKKEQCIVLKHQRDAEKFLEQDCGRYVNYN
ncbi:hypothetical protein inny_230 [Escherichia phage inny]|uniref:Uncharacterized protein n=1 Tax=Escherichia phage muut TaxID=2696426 RepID=A0A6B9WP86_9CAUD|nr:hypothetical protein JR322_gp134 [Escherichia phage muut]QHR67564.1 hypothetical protein arall_120 [Escherichia phage arall]QHR69900.1 hypothetical protein inny_230 [Escherichia phage inny]CAH7774819.1 hypothetical protein G377_gp232 [Escherichiaphage phAPEC8] [Escherichia phage vB_Eco_PATM]HAN6306077.1 hypothetical protein [Escherichia coli]QHR65911.1 hypothetical protein muut_114 [Escherichia phage muut]